MKTEELKAIKEALTRHKLDVNYKLIELNMQSKNLHPEQRRMIDTACKVNDFMYNHAMLATDILIENPNIEPEDFLMALIENLEKRPKF